MRNKQLLRYSLASLSLAAAGFGVFLVACGDDDNTVTPTNTPDSGGTDSSTPADSSTPEDSGSDAGPTLPNAKLQLVNAASDFGPANPSGALRVCYGVGASDATATVAPLPPLPDRASPGASIPGVFIGTGGAVQGTGADLTNLAVVPYVMNAASLAGKGLVKPDTAGNPGTSCTDIIAGNIDGGALTMGVDYWKLPAIPPGTFQKGKSFILVLTGCVADAVGGSTGKCGPDWVSGAPGNGNLKVTIYEVDRATQVPADKFGAQFIHASPQGDTIFANGASQLKFRPAITKDADGGGVILPVAQADVPLGGKVDLAQLSGVKFDAPSDYFTFNTSAPPALFIRLTSVQQASYGATVPDGGEYRNGAAFTFIAVGDPAATPFLDAGDGTTPVFNTRTFHYIALPNDPINETYKP